MQIRNVICRRKFSKKKFFIIVCIILAIFLIINSSKSSIDDDEEWYKHPLAYFKDIPCEHDEYTYKLHETLTKKMSEVFEKLGLKYFLCYGRYLINNRIIKSELLKINILIKLI
jgi:hypothetical protein